MPDSGNFEIRDLDDLSARAAKLGKYVQQLYYNSKSLKHVNRLVQQNWENVSGQDNHSICENLNKYTRILDEEIQPILKKYINTINQIVAETKISQKRNM